MCRGSTFRQSVLLSRDTRSAIGTLAEPERGDGKVDKMMEMLMGISAKLEAQDVELREQRSIIAGLRSSNPEPVQEERADVVMQTGEDDEDETRTFRHRTGELKAFSGERSEWVAWQTEALTVKGWEAMS